jgi:hypothetical protein
MPRRQRILSVGWLYLTGLCLLFASNLLRAGEDVVWLTVDAPFIDVHTGAGDGFPVFHVIERGQRLQVLDRRADWFRVADEKGRAGWVPRESLLRTRLANGEPLRFEELDQQAFIGRQWEVGVSGGRLKGAPLVSVYGGYAFTENLSAELTLEHSVGTVSSSKLLRLGLLMQPFPEWSYSPFFTIGAGYISVRPNATLIEPHDKDNTLASVGIGFKTWLARRFVLRFEVDEMVIFSANKDQDDNEEITEWKLGFAVFF